MHGCKLTFSHCLDASEAACLECGVAALLSARSVPGREGCHHQQVVAPSSCMQREPGSMLCLLPTGQVPGCCSSGYIVCLRQGAGLLLSLIHWQRQAVSSSSPAESAASFFLAALASSRLSGGLKNIGFPHAMAATIVSTGLMHLHVAVAVIARLAAVLLLQLLTQMVTRSDISY